MSFDLSHDIKEQVRQATDIVDLVGRSIHLRRDGRGFAGLCPWHDDTKPSLHINPERQSWKCWVCDIGGDVFSFVMKREGVDFPTALQMLAERAGIQLTSHRQAKIEPGSPNDKQTLYRAMAWAEQQYHQCLINDAVATPAREYLSDRGINDESVKRFHIGFAPESFQWLLDRAKSKGFSPAVLIAAGLATRKSEGRNPYDSFRGRLMFPIRDTEHRAVAFGGRILPQIERESNRPSPKYINTPETRLFSKSSQLYGLDIVREAIARDRRIVVVEGYTDVVMAHQQRVQTVVAVLGTA